MSKILSIMIITKLFPNFFVGLYHMPTSQNLECKVKISASLLFDEEPREWGFRGDPYFWDYLQKIFESYDISEIDEKKIEDIIKSEYEKLSETPLTSDSIGYCELFDHGGLSHGGLSGEFWINKGIPILKEQLKKYKNI